MNSTKQELIAKIESRVEDKALERSNADLLIKLINNADSIDEAISIAALGTMYKRTGLHFDPRLEKMSNTIKYFEKNEALSFTTWGQNARINSLSAITTMRSKISLFNIRGV